MRGFSGITQNPSVLGGKPCIGGQRSPSALIVGQIEAGRGIDQLLADDPYFTHENVLEALRNAAWRVAGREIDLTRTRTKTPNR